MALSASQQIEVRSTGSDTNGGGFKAGASGVDRSQQDSPQYSVTDGVTAGSTTITSATAAFGTDVVGNLIYVQGGTGSVTAGWYEITARASGTSITVDRSTGLTTGTGVTLHIGGGLLTIAKALSILPTGGVAWLKGSATYSSAAKLAMVSNGGNPPNIAFTHLMGYYTTHGDYPTGSNRPTITCSGGSTIDGISLDTKCVLAHCLVTGSSSARDGIVGASYSGVNAFAVNCDVTTFTRRGTYQVRTQGCRVHGLIAGATTAIECAGTGQLYSLADANPCSGFSVEGNNSGTHLFGCIAANNTGSSSHGFALVTLAGSVMSHLVAVGNGGDGLHDASYDGTSVINSIFVSNGAYGLNLPYGSLVASPMLDYNAFYGNATARNNSVAGPHDVTLTGNPFVNSSGGDFSLNTTTGQGAALRAMGFPGLLPNGVVSGHVDIGVVQHGDPAAAGGLLTHPGMSGGMRG